MKILDGDDPPGDTLEVDADMKHGQMTFARAAVFLKIALTRHRAFRDGYLSIMSSGSAAQRNSISPSRPRRHLIAERESC